MINIEDVKTISLKPNQVLVVQTESKLNQDQRTQLKHYLEAIFRDNKVMIIDKSISLLVVDPEKEST